MKQLKCISRYTNRGEIVGYRVIDENGRMYNVSATELKKSVKEGYCVVTNLVYTSDGRFIFKDSDANIRNKYNGETVVDIAGGADKLDIHVYDIKRLLNWRIEKSEIIGKPGSKLSRISFTRRDVGSDAGRLAKLKNYIEYKKELRRKSMIDYTIQELNDYKVYEIAGFLFNFLFSTLEEFGCFFKLSDIGFEYDEDTGKLRIYAYFAETHRKEALRHYVPFSIEIRVYVQDVIEYIPNSCDDFVVGINKEYWACTTLKQMKELLFSELSKMSRKNIYHPMVLSDDRIENSNIVFDKVIEDNICSMANVWLKCGNIIYMECLDTNATTVLIPKGIDIISDNAFDKLANLTNIICLGEKQYAEATAIIENSERCDIVKVNLLNMV